MKQKECPACAMNVDSDKRICPICGYEFPKDQQLFKILVALLVIVFVVFIAFSI
jgi:RNA polymerase subunit RPABC4/transcription elongation factor Spt4